MRAAWYEKQGPARDVLTVGEMPDPHSAAGEVRIRFDGDGKADLAWQDDKNAWVYSSRGCVAPAVLRSNVLYWPPLLSFKVGDFDHDRKDDFLNYESHWNPFEKRVIMDTHFAATQGNSTYLVYSRHEMR